MYCLLCHEKIPRLRAWRTKSEFCSDECAAQFKRQTLERLLTEEEGEGNDSVPLPLDEPAPDDLDVSAAPEAPATAHDESPSGSGGASDDLAALFDEHDSQTPPERAPFEESGAGALGGEAWQMPGEIGRPDDLPDLPSGDAPVGRQSAEDALEALRSLASRADGEDSEAPDSEQPAAGGKADELDELEAALPDEPDFVADMDLLESEPLPQPTAEDSEESEDSGPSILSRLVEDDEPATASGRADAEASEPEGVEEEAATGAAEEAAASSSDPELEPSDDEFVHSMMAAVEGVEADAGERLSKVVPFPETDEKKAADAPGADDGSEPGETDAEEAGPAATAESEPESPPREAESASRKRARKAPRLRPAMVMAGLFPTPSGGDEPATPEWKELTAASAGSAPPAELRVEGPLLNGLTASAAGSGRRLEPFDGITLSEPELGSAPPSAGQPAFPDEPALSTVQPAWPAFEPQLADAAPALQPAERLFVAVPEAVLPAADAAGVEAPRETSAPLAPNESYYESVSEVPLNAPGDEDAEWFADIEGFESP